MFKVKGWFNNNKNTYSLPLLVDTKWNRVPQKFVENVVKRHSLYQKVAFDSCDCLSQKCRMINSQGGDLHEIKKFDRSLLESFSFSQFSTRLDNRIPTTPQVTKVFKVRNIEEGKQVK